MDHYDVIIIGTGAGGGTLAHRLAPTGKRILLLERGGYLPREPENWDSKEVFLEERYLSGEEWIDKDGDAFRPHQQYFVGGNTKFYGAILFRLRERDFHEVRHHAGVSPAWPLTYDDFEPYYTEAERLYLVHGERGEDPTEAPASGPFPYPAVSHEPRIQQLHDDFVKTGHHPFHLPVGVDLDESDPEGGRCVRCDRFDGFPCLTDGKADAHVRCVRPALKHPNVTLRTNSRVVRLETDASGRTVTGVVVERGGVEERHTADIVVVACGAANSAALLLRSAGDAHPNGLANSSGLVGRNYMVHNNTAVMAVHPTRRNPTVFQKTLGVNDLYLRGPDRPYPLGNLQLLGKLQAGMLTADRPLVPRPVLRAMANRSVDWWVMSEDLPDPDNRVTLAPDGTIRVHWKPNNLVAHEEIVQTARQMLRRAGYPLVLTQRLGIETNSHQCGTLRFGHDPATSVLDPCCRAHDIQNLYVVDASFFPSSTATNPALTIA